MVLQTCSPGDGGVGRDRQMLRAYWLRNSEFLKTKIEGGWCDSLAVKSTCSSRGPRFGGFKHPPGISVPGGSATFFWPLHMVHPYASQLFIHIQ